MECLAMDAGAAPVSIEASRFRGKSGVEEFHLILCPARHAAFAEQLEWTRQAWLGALAELGLDASSAVWRRFFLSDPANQADALAATPFGNPFAAGSVNGGDDGREPCAVSIVGQPPSPPAKVALWAYHVRDPRGPIAKFQSGSTLALRRGGQTRLWMTGMTSPGEANAHDQTRSIFEKLQSDLAGRGLTLAENLLRTWIFVRRVDDDYQGVVAARRDFFAAHGLTPQAHYVASTGIQGAPANGKALVAMDAFCMQGVAPAQVRHLAAPDRLPPASAYGVTFERATEVACRDRACVLVSGTASIDRDGRIMHAGGLERQLDRAIDNVEALLAQAGASLADLAMAIVYARDPSDHEALRRQTRARLGGVPFLVATAPVCRSGWLVEIEGLATIEASNPDLPSF